MNFPLNYIINIGISSLFALVLNIGNSQSPYPVRGLCVKAPAPENLTKFVEFIDEDLVNAGVNTLILRVDWGYEYQSHPELRGNNPLKHEQVKKLVQICQKNNIRLIPQINLLGHQSWHSTLGKLLEVYPEFDETPGIDLPDDYKWPNEDGLYCKSYCPLHPDVHDVVFALVDEILEVFEADAFHAGLDEVFYLAHEDCPRCKGRDPAVLFANEVNRIQTHLDKTDTELWMWGDRLIDGRTTGIGMWEASYNNTWRAIDMIDKDVVICDWHYERADATAFLFASKGYRVATCPWRKPDVAVRQKSMLSRFIDEAAPTMKDRYLGMIQTVWTSVERFMTEYRHPEQFDDRNTSGNCFRELSEAWKEGS